MNPTIYLITYHKFNHDTSRKENKPLDERFLGSEKNFVYYLIDQEIPKPLEGKSLLFEYKIDPEIYEAGKYHFGEWSFLLAEAKHGFCNYPFFMVSSRFYEKNNWLINDLNEEWDRLFSYFDHYNYAWLPSYDRPLRWIDYGYWKKRVEDKSCRFSPFTKEVYALSDEFYRVNIPKDYRYCSDLFCNYIGFKSRKHLLDYVNFYRPLIDSLFDEKFRPKQDLSRFVMPTGNYRNEKPFTFVLELFSHLFFFKNKEKLFTLHYDGYYEVDEYLTQFKLLEKIEMPFSCKMKRTIDWKYRKSNSEGLLSELHALLRPLKKYKFW